ncbi:hypothetical protein Tco_1006893 [Tanacetum coccineum]|uniref:Uncharacterized protein n=1 Tax=Tanacetum coccineum TaxID=301880 RepID=A0ABQ5FK80_9ASTR
MIERSIQNGINKLVSELVATSKFGGNDESKKMQKYILKQQFKSFSVSNSEGLHKGYDRFQSLLSQLEIHGASVSTEDANQKFLRSLPASWSQVSLIMRTKPGVDTLSFDDLYNNLRVFESDIKGSTASSSSTQNVAFVSSESTNSTNDVSTAYGVSTSSGHNSQKEGSSSYTDELKYLLANLNQGEGCSLMPRNQLALTRPRLSASIAITHGTLLESAYQKEIKKREGVNAWGTLDLKHKRMGETWTTGGTLSFSNLDGMVVDWEWFMQKMSKERNFALMRSQHQARH